MDWVVVLKRLIEAVGLPPSGDLAQALLVGATFAENIDVVFTAPCGFQMRIPVPQYYAGPNHVAVIGLYERDKLGDFGREIYAPGQVVRGLVPHHQRNNARILFNEVVDYLTAPAKV